MSTHALKTWPEYFKKVVTGEKRFEVRKNDRDFKEGDFLILEEYEPKKGYTGNRSWQKVTYILSDPDFVKHGHIVMSIELATVDF